jgi:uncharacterized membrane protein YdfJ with MMPL/SSD domain
MFAGLARLAQHHARIVVLAALLLAAVAGAFGYSVAERLDPLGFGDPASESARANAELAQRGFPSPDVVIRVDDPAALPGVAEVVRAEPAVLAATPVSSYLMVSLRAADDKAKTDAAKRIESGLRDRPGVQVGGPAASFAQLNRTIQADLVRAELFAFPFLFVLSLLFFRSLVAAALPVLVGGLSVVTTFLGLRLVSEVLGISSLALNVVTALGTGLAIDYSLFMVSRYREELARHGPGLAALRATLATAGRTVLFSALTVAATTASLLIFPQQFLYSIGIGGMLVSVLAAAAALLVLPSVLALLGHRVNALAPRWLKRSAERDAQPVTKGAWYRISMFVMRRPAAIALVTAAVMVVLALPFLGLRLTSLDASVLPRDSEPRQVYEALRRDGLDSATKAIVVVSHDSDPAALAARLGALPSAGSVGEPVRLDARTAVLTVVPPAPVYSAESQDLLAAVRSVDGATLVTGPTAEFVDLRSSMRAHLPAAALIIVVATMLALYLMTGSVVLGVKALVMNFLTLGAVFGALVFVFQDGRLQGALGYTGQGALESTMPLIVFAGVFALSTDFGVFLLARIKEARDSGVPDRLAVATGQAQTGRLITSAASLFCIAVGAFGTSRIVGMKEMTLGIAFGVLLDATLIRIFLVPSIMQLLDRWNWWAPRPLAALHRRIGLTEMEPPAGPPQERRRGGRHALRAP